MLPRLVPIRRPPQHPASRACCRRHRRLRRAPATPTPTPPPLEIAPPPLVLPAASAPAKAPAKPAARLRRPGRTCRDGRCRTRCAHARCRDHAVPIRRTGRCRRRRQAARARRHRSRRGWNRDRHRKGKERQSVVLGPDRCGRRCDVLQFQAAALELTQRAGRGHEGGSAAPSAFSKAARNWFGLQTKDSLLVLRVDDDAVGRVTAGLQERTGLTLQRLVEPKD